MIVNGESLVLPRREPSTSTGLWFNNLAVLSVELIGYRFRRSSMSAILAVGEPVGLVAFVTLLQWMNGVLKPPYGSSTALFYTTGVMPMYLFFHTSLRFRTWDYLPRFPNFGELQLALATMLAELFGKLFIIVICCLVLYLWGAEEAIPVNPLLCILALLLMMCCGVGLGLVNAVIAAFFSPWTYIYQVLVRAWMAFSGVLSIIDYAPRLVRTAASWVPVSHAVILYRLGQYGQYPHFIYDFRFLALSALGMLGFGMVCESGSRRWRNFR